jgi:hypothetical protein
VLSRGAVEMGRWETIGSNKCGLLAARWSSGWFARDLMMMAIVVCSNYTVVGN